MEENKQLISVSADIIQSIIIKLNYNNNIVESITVSENDIVNIDYTDNNKILSIEGRVKCINKYNGTTTSRTICSKLDTQYNLDIDCSKNYISDLRIVNVANIRSISVIKEEETDPELPPEGIE